MNKEAASAVPASAEGAFGRQSFIRTARPALVSKTYPKQRYYGSQSEDLPDARGLSVGRVDVFRRADDDVARLTMHLGYGGAVGMVRMSLAPEVLRKLAGRLIDAAADIEANPASTLMAAAHDGAGAAA